MRLQPAPAAGTRILLPAEGCGLTPGGLWLKACAGWAAPCSFLVPGAQKQEGCRRWGVAPSFSEAGEGVTARVGGNPPLCPLRDRCQRPAGCTGADHGAEQLLPWAGTLLPAPSGPPPSGQWLPGPVAVGEALGTCWSTIGLPGGQPAQVVSSAHHPPPSR